MAKLKTIYALCDPSRPIIPKYIGRTGTTIEARIYQHMADACAGRMEYNPELRDWLLSLHRSKQLPVGIVYEVTDQETASIREAFWTFFFRPSGLLNIKTGDRHALVTRPKMNAPVVRAIWNNNKAHKGFRFRRSVPVVSVTTGEKFPSVTAAAKAIKRSTQALHMALNKGGKCVGQLWRYA